MALMESVATLPRETECRRCCAFCDKLVDPVQCVEMGCRYLYSYRDERSQRRYLGCVEKVFRAEIDIDLLEAARRRNCGYGGIRATGRPLPHCPFSVENAYQGQSEAFHCTNPRFFDCSESGPEAVQAFDLRQAV